MYRVKIKKENTFKWKIFKRRDGREEEKAGKEKKKGKYKRKKKRKRTKKRGIGGETKKKKNRITKNSYIFGKLIHIGFVRDFKF